MRSRRKRRGWVSRELKNIGTWTITSDFWFVMGLGAVGAGIGRIISMWSTPLMNGVAGLAQLLVGCIVMKVAVRLQDRVTKQKVKEKEAEAQAAQAEADAMYRENQRHAFDLFALASAAFGVPTFHVVIAREDEEVSVRLCQGGHLPPEIILRELARVSEMVRNGVVDGELVETLGDDGTGKGLADVVRLDGPVNGRPVLGTKPQSPPGGE